MKKKCAALFIFLFTFFNICGQELSDIGIFAGGSYYLGEINPGKQFYSPGIAIGFMYRYNLNRRYSVKANFNYGKLAANDIDFNNAFQQQRNQQFSSSVFDCTLQTEFNFLPYSHLTTDKHNITPYCTIGLGVMLLSNTTFSKPLTIPFGVGLKYCPIKKFTLGAEWSFRKTFNDNIDGLANVTDSNNIPVMHNKDWYSFAGITISYKLFSNRDNCPVYW